MEPLLGAIVGGLIAGLFTLLGARYAFARALKTERERREDRRRTEAKNLAGALLAEITTLKERYMKSAGTALEEATEWSHFLAEWPIMSNYFTVFEQNAGRLGILAQEDGKAVVRMYVIAKGHLDGMAQWSKYVSEFGRITEERLLGLDPKDRDRLLDLDEQRLAALPANKPKVPKYTSSQMDAIFNSIPKYRIVKAKLQIYFAPLKKSHTELLDGFEKVSARLAAY